MTPTIDEIYTALRQVVDPELHQDVVTLNMVRDVEIEDANVRLSLYLTTMACPLIDSLAAQVHHAVASLPGIAHVGVDIKEMSQEEVAAIAVQIRAHTGVNGQQKAGSNHSAPLSFSLDPEEARLTQSLAQSLSPIKHVIGITSGKGGVGKSLVTGMLAVALRRQGYEVGIFDVDITGASIPTLFGLNGVRMKSSPEGVIPTPTKGGIRIVSANFMLKNPDDPVAWRGSRIAQLISDLWRDVVWGPLDYLLIDFPPGTSDAQLTVMMDLPLRGLIMVTTPQELASLIVRKAVKLSQDMRIPLLGIVENMSYFVCPDTGSKHEIFGPSHAIELAAKIGVPLLAQLPVEPTLAQAVDAGQLETYRMPLLDGLAQSLEVSMNLPAAK
ncbi:MAG: Mrp/NBP35 family ATP-binding protein [Chloroflexi bacterium]|nr:Mrp/NBP35 family ATP-binding protein [Chloroflexota bacterium]